MAEAAAHGGESKSARLKHELVALWWAFLYLFILFGMFVLYRQVLLHGGVMDGFRYGFAALNALVFAKVILIGDMMKVGTRADSRPLVWSVLYKSAAFAGFFIVFHIIEDAVIGLFHSKSLAESFAADATQLNATMIAAVIFAIAMVPYFAFREIIRAAGPDRMRTLLFAEGGVVKVFGAPK